MIALQENDMKTTALVLIVLGAGLGLRAGDPEAEIRDAEKAWAQAVVAQDWAAVDKILGEKLIYAHATGGIESKKQYLDRVRSGAQKYDTINHESTRIVVYGDSAVTHSIMRMAGATNGAPFNDHLMMMHVWEKQGGSWKLAAHQTTKLPDSQTP
jgi:ketosteroid isomerase-like protein